MKRFATLALATSFAAADCTTTALGANNDPYFAWLITGTNEQRASNVSAICASASNTARTNFDSKLNELIAACVPTGTDVSTSTFGVVASLLNKVLCEQKVDLGAARYCILSLLPLFDVPYLMSLSQGNFKLPPLGPVGDDANRQSAMCISNVCNSFIENIAPSLLSALPSTSAAAIASEFIRGTVSRMRCGCVGKTPCQSSSVANALIDSNGVFIETAACDANGMPTQCARNWMTCQNTPPPKCVKPCANKNIATIKFVLRNLNYTCVANGIDNIKSDVIANVPGLLSSDFSCACNEAVAPEMGTACKCEITCGNLLVLKDLDLVREFGSLSTRAGAIVVPAPALDKLLPSSCKLTANSESYGSSFVLVDASMSATGTDNTNGAVAVGLSAFVAVLLAAVF